MKNILEKYKIIELRKEGTSYRKIAKKTGIDRKTISRICTKYYEATNILENEETYDLVKLQEVITNSTSYDSSKRVKMKYNETIDNRINELLKSEEMKKKDLGTNKQYLTQTKIHQILVKEGHDISISTVANHIREKKKNMQ